jgi:hypothetical protein
LALPEFSPYLTIIPYDKIPQNVNISRTELKSLTKHRKGKLMSLYMPAHVSALFLLGTAIGGAVGFLLLKLVDRVLWRSQIYTLAHSSILVIPIVAYICLLPTQPLTIQDTLLGVAFGANALEYIIYVLSGWTSYETSRNMSASFIRESKFKFLYWGLLAAGEIALIGTVFFLYAWYALIALPLLDYLNMRYGMIVSPTDCILIGKRNRD